MTQKKKGSVPKMNYVFVVFLLILSCSFLSSALVSKYALITIYENSEYKHIDCDMERKFNVWDFERDFKMYLFLTCFVGLVYIFYLLSLLEWKR